MALFGGHPQSGKLLQLVPAILSRLQILQSEMKEKYVRTENEKVNTIIKANKITRMFTRTTSATTI